MPAKLTLKKLATKIGKLEAQRLHPPAPALTPLTLKKLAAHDLDWAGRRSPAIASRNLKRRVRSTMERETDSTHTQHDYPKAKIEKLAMSILRNNPEVYDLARKKLKQEQKRRSKVLTKARDKKEEKEEKEKKKEPTAPLRNNSSMSLERAERLGTFQTAQDIKDEEQRKKRNPLPCNLLGGKKKKGKRKTKRHRKTRRRKTRRRKTRRRTKRRVKKHRKRKTRKRKK